MNLKKEILHTSKTFLIVMILFFAVQFIYAWTGPNLPPPGDNTETPINVSSTAQTKTGGLTVGGLTLPQGATITGNGTNSTYGATTIKGSKNSYSGINFKDSSNANAGTLMMGPSYSGFFNGADSQWRMYVIETGIANQMGNVVANDFYSNASGKWMSQMGGGVKSVTMNCYDTYQQGCIGNGYFYSKTTYCRTCVDGICSGYVNTGTGCY